MKEKNTTKIKRPSRIAFFFMSLLLVIIVVINGVLTIARPYFGVIDNFLSSAPTGAALDEITASAKDITLKEYVRQLENEPCADLILSHPVMARK